MKYLVETKEGRKIAATMNEAVKMYQGYFNDMATGKSDEEQMSIAAAFAAHLLFSGKIIPVPDVKEYRLMYMFGAWVTSAVICAENDKEAIFDAKCELGNRAANGLRYALFQGNRMVYEF